MSSTCQIGHEIDNKTTQLDTDILSETKRCEDLSDREIIFDLSIDLKTRMKSMIQYQNDNPQELLEIINRLCGMFQFSGTNIIKRYLIQICKCQSIHDDYKMICVKSLCYFYETIPNTIYDVLDDVCQQVVDKNTVGTPCKIELILLLLTSDNHKDQSLVYFSSIVNDTVIDVDYRYKTILSIENTKNIDFLHKVCMNFIKCTTNFIRYKILACQCVLQNCQEYMENKEHEYVQSELLSYGHDTELDINVRADAVDVLLSLGDNEMKTIAKDLIHSLGRDINGRDTVVTIWEDGQNVHTEEIEKSVLDVVDKLMEHDTLEINKIPIDIHYVLKQISDRLKNEEKNCVEKSIHMKLNEDDHKTFMKPFFEKKDHIQISLNRIYNDRMLYTRHQLTLSHILVKLWSWIHLQHQHVNELTNRLEEELLDMSGTCSTGYITRLVNVLSGFSDVCIKISWKDQIVANFKSRLNTRIMCIEDEEFQEKVLHELTLPVGEYDKRLNFLKFFRENMLLIREELYTEFRDCLSDHQFDLFIRNAIMDYEGVQIKE